MVAGDAAAEMHNEGPLQIGLAGSETQGDGIGVETLERRLCTQRLMRSTVVALLQIMAEAQLQSRAVGIDFDPAVE